VYYLRLFYFTLNQNNMKLVFKFVRIWCISIGNLVVGRYYL
jgi:hypothetical protein